MENLRSTFVQLMEAVTTDDALMCTRKLEMFYSGVDGIRFSFEIMLNDQSADLQKLACITLKRYITGSMWKSLANPERQQIKQRIFQMILAMDSNPIVRKLIDLTVVLMDFENDDLWYQELLAEVWKKLYANNEEENNHGSYILACMSEYMPHQLIRLAMTELFKYFDRALAFVSTNQVYSSLCLLNVYDAMGNITYLIDFEESNQALVFFNQNLPIILTILFNLRQDPNDFCIVCDILDGLVDHKPKVDQYAQNLVDFCLSIVTDFALSDDVRDRVFDILENLVDYKSEFINLEPITEATFSIMAQDNNVNADWGDIDGLNIYDDAMRILLSVISQMDPNMMTNMFLQIFIRAKQSSSLSSFGLLRTYYSFLALMAGERSYILSENLDTFMNILLHGLNPKNSALRNPALNTLRNFASALAPNMRKYASISIRTLMQLMNQLSIDYQKTLDSSQLLNIIEAFKAVLQVVKEGELLDLLLIMNQLISTLKVSRCLDLTCSILSCTTKVIQSAKASMDPLIPQLLQIVQGFTWKVNENARVVGNDDTLEIGAQALEVIGALMKYCSIESYAPFIGGTLSYAQQLMNDVGLMKTFNLNVIILVDCASFVAKNEVAPLMPQVVSLIMGVIDSQSEEAPSEISQIEEYMRYNADNANDDVAIGLVAVKELINNSPTAILPYCVIFEATVTKLMKKFHRKCFIMIQCINISLNLIIAFSSNRQDDHIAKSLDHFVKIWCSLIQFNSEPLIVAAALETLIKALDTFRREATCSDHIKTLIPFVVLKILTHETRTQKTQESSAVDEYRILEETTMKKIYRLGLALLTAIGQTSSAMEFRQIFQPCFPALLEILKGAKNDQRLAKELSDTFIAMNDYINILTHLTPNECTALLPLLYDGMTSTCCLVRENSVRCIGTMLLQTESGSPQLYEQVLSKLHTYDTNFSQKDGYGALCSCLVKIALVSASAIPAESTINLVLMNIPLMGFEDDHEYIFRFFTATLPTLTNTEIYFKTIVLKTLDILSKKKFLNNNILEAGKNLFKCLYNLDQVKFDQVVMDKPQAVDAIRALMS